MKKYISPKLNIDLIQVEGLIALSLYEDPATGDDALTKEDKSEDIWGTSDKTFEHQW